MPEITQKDVAHRAGVSPSTVSAALRGLPNIPDATRRKVLNAAKELDYRPGSPLSALANYRSPSQAGRATGIIAYLATKSHHPYSIPNHADWLSFQGLRERAEQCGYEVQVIDLVDNRPAGPQLTQRLQDSGIAALVIPKIDSLAETPELDWSRFAAIEIGHGAATQFLNRISPDQFDTTRQALHNVAQLGYQRPGLIMRRDILHSLEEWPLAAWQIASRIEGLTAGIPPFSPETHSQVDTAFRDWLTTHRPDVLLSNLPLPGSLHRIAGEIMDRDPAPFAILGRKPGQEYFAGVVEPLRECGHLAADLLIAQVQRQEIGLPAEPTMTLLRGHWHPGPSLRST
jgi:DNA-binding LacI/PurR family transcriptional regulator